MKGAHELDVACQLAQQACRAFNVCRQVIFILQAGGAWLQVYAMPSSHVIVQGQATIVHGGRPQGASARRSQQRSGNTRWPPSLMLPLNKLRPGRIPAVPLAVGAAVEAAAGRIPVHARVCGSRRGGTASARAQSQHSPQIHNAGPSPLLLGKHESMPGLNFCLQ